MTKREAQAVEYYQQGGIAYVNVNGVFDIDVAECSFLGLITRPESKECDRTLWDLSNAKTQLDPGDPTRLAITVQRSMRPPSKRMCIAVVGDDLGLSSVFAVFKTMITRRNLEFRVFRTKSEALFWLESGCC